MDRAQACGAVTGQPRTDLHAPDRGVRRLEATVSTAVYFANMNALGYQPLSAWSPRLTVRPEVEAFGPAGLISSKPRTISVDPETDYFEVTLVPSSEMTGTDGRIGVKYVLELALFDTTIDGSDALVRHDIWVFTAFAGGGPIRDMGQAPPIGFFVGPPWPGSPRPGTYFDTESGDIGTYAVGVNF